GGGVDDRGKVALFWKTAGGAAPRGGRVHGGPADLLGDVFERAVALVLIEYFALRVAGLGGQLFDFGVDVAVDQEDVEPAVIVEIHEPAAPSQKARVDADPRGDRHVLEAQQSRFHAQVAVEDRSVA